MTQARGHPREELEPSCSGRGNNHEERRRGEIHGSAVRGEIRIFSDEIKPLPAFLFDLWGFNFAALVSRPCHPYKLIAGDEAHVVYNRASFEAELRRERRLRLTLYVLMVHSC